MKSKELIDTSSITVGTDIEFFLQDKESNEFISSQGLIPGTKESPVKLKELGEGFGIQPDNVAVEFTMPESKSKEEWVKSINKIKTFCETGGLPYGLKLAIIPSAYFPEHQLQSEGAMQAGCDPDFNVWLEEANVAPDIKASSLRSCGGHIHVGYVSPNTETSSKIIMAMDLFLGLPSILLDNSKESMERRKLYGKAGCFRFKSFGVEYRTLSNFWTKTDELIKWAFEATLKACEFVNSSEFDEIYNDQENIIKAINEGNKTLAEIVIEKYSVPVLQLV
jgi:hypothetical protein